MKLRSIILSIIIVISIIYSSVAIAQGMNGQRNYINFTATDQGSILNFTVNNELLINSINIYPHQNGQWLQRGQIKIYYDGNIFEKIMYFKNPVIDIFSRESVSIGISFNGFNVSRAVSFSGFIIESIDSVGFVNNGNFTISNSNVYINSSGNLNLKIFMKNDLSFGNLSQYMQSDDFDGAVYISSGNYTVEMTNESLNITSLQIKNGNIYIDMIKKSADGIFIIDLAGYQEPLGIVVNGTTLTNQPLNDVINENLNSYNITSINGSYVYLISISSFSKSIPQSSFTLEYILLLSVIIIISVSGIVTLRRVIKK